MIIDLLFKTNRICKHATVVKTSLHLFPYGCCKFLVPIVCGKNTKLRFYDKTRVSGNINTNEIETYPWYAKFIIPEKYFLKREVKYVVCTNMYRSVYQCGNYKHFNHNSYLWSEQNSYETEIMVKVIFP